MERVSSVSLYHRTIRDPQSITKSIYGHFSSDRSHEFIISRATFLEMISYSKELNRWDIICSMDTHSFIRDISVYHVPGSRRDYILVGTDSGSTTLLKYNVHKGRFEPVVSEPFGRSGIRRTVAGQYVCADPHGRSILVSALERTKIAYEMSNTSTNPAEPALQVSSGVESANPNTVTYAITGIHYTDTELGSPLYAALEGKYSESTVGSHDGDQDAIVKPLSNTVVQKRLTFYQHDTNLRSVSPLMSLPVPASATDLIALPLNAKYPGGVLVLCENCVLYYPMNASLIQHTLEVKTIQEDKGQSISQEELVLDRVLRVDFPTRASTVPKNTMIASHAVFSLATKRQTTSFVLLQTELGDLFKLELIPSTVDSLASLALDEIQLFYLDTLPVASSLSLSDTGYLLATCDVGDTIILRITDPTINPTDPLYCMTSSNHYAPQSIEAISTALLGGQQQQQQQQALTRPQILLTTSISSIFLHYSDEERSTMAFYPIPLYRLAYRASIPSLAPLRAAAIYDPFQSTSTQDQSNASGASLSSATIYTGIGSSSRSMIVANKLGVAFLPTTNTPIGQHISRFYPVATSTASYSHSLVMICHEFSSLLLSYSDQLDQVTHPHIVYDEPTLAFVSASDPHAVTTLSDPNEPAIHTTTRFYLDGVALIHATPRRLRCITANNTFSEWRRPNTSDPIRFAAFNGNNLLITIISSYLYVIAYSPSHGQTSGLLHEVAQLNTGFIVNHLSVLQPANGVVGHVASGGARRTALHGGLECLFAISGLDNIVRFYTVHRRMDKYVVEMTSSQSITISSASTTTSQMDGDSQQQQHASISSLLLVDRHTHYECYIAYDNYVSVVRLNVYGESEHIHHYYTGIISIPLSPSFVITQQQQADTLQLPLPSTQRGALQLSILVNSNAASQSVDAIARTVDITLTNGVQSLVYRDGGWSNINVSSPLQVDDIEYVMDASSTTGEYTSGSSISPQHDPIYHHNRSTIHSSLSTVVSFNLTHDTVKPIILASSSISSDNIQSLSQDYSTHRGLLTSTGSSNFLICNEVPGNTHPNMPVTQLLQQQAPDHLSNHHLSPLTAATLHNNSSHYDHHKYSDQFMVTHSSPTVYTPRQLHVLNIHELLQRNYLTSQYHPSQYTSNMSLKLSSSGSVNPNAGHGTSEMGDQDDGTSGAAVERRRCFLPRDTILDDGTHKITQQTGALIISIEGDNYSPSPRECGESYTVAIDNFYKPLLGISPDGDSMDGSSTGEYALTPTEAAVVGVPYSIPTSTGCVSHTGGNLLEFHTGYPRGPLAASYRGIIRLLTPQLQTIATVATPEGFTIICSTIAVFETSTCLVIGGNFHEYDEETQTNRLIGGLLTYALYQYHDRETVEQQQAYLNTCQTKEQSSQVLSTILSSPLLSSHQWHADLIHITKHPLTHVRALLPIHYNRSLLVALNDSLCIYELGKKRLLFKSKFSLQRGMISSLTCAPEYTIQDHTDDANMMIYVGFHGQGVTMVRLTIRLNQTKAGAGPHGIPLRPIVKDQATLSVHPPIDLETNASSLTSAYQWYNLCSMHEQRYVLSSCPVPGGMIGGDRFGNIFLVSPDQDQVVTLMYNPLNPNQQEITLNNAALAQTPSSNAFGSLSVFAETHLGSPITNVFSIQNGKKIVYTALDGRIGVLSPVGSPITHNIMQQVLQSIYHRTSITHYTLRKFTSYYSPCLNILHGDQFIHVIRAAAAALSSVTVSDQSTTTTGSDSTQDEFLQLARGVVTQLSDEIGIPVFELVRRCFDLDSTLTR